MFGVLKGLGKVTKIGGALKHVAPLLAAGVDFAPGGPIAKAALRAVVDVVGGDVNDPSSVEAGLDNITGAQLVELKKAEAKFEAETKKAGIDLERARLADTQDARRAHKDSWVPAALSAAIVAAFIACFLVPMFHEVKEEIIQDAIVGLGPLAGACVSYWMGSSRAGDKMMENGR